MSTKQKNNQGTAVQVNDPNVIELEGKVLERDRVINALQQRLDDTERKLEDALARLEDALKQTVEFVPHGDDPLLDLTEAGELVGRSHQTIRNMIQQKMLRCIQEPGGLMRVRKSSLVKLFSEAFLIDEEQRERDEENTRRIRENTERMLAEKRARDAELRIEAPPEGSDTYVNPVLLALRREREQV